MDAKVTATQRLAFPTDGREAGGTTSAATVVLALLSALALAGFGLVGVSQLNPVARLADGSGRGLEPPAVVSITPPVMTVPTRPAAQPGASRRAAVSADAPRSQFLPRAGSPRTGSGTFAAGREQIPAAAPGERIAGEPRGESGPLVAPSATVSTYSIGAAASGHSARSADQAVVEKDKGKNASKRLRTTQTELKSTAPAAPRTGRVLGKKYGAKAAKDSNGAKATDESKQRTAAGKVSKGAWPGASAKRASGAKAAKAAKAAKVDKGASGGSAAKVSKRVSGGNAAHQRARHDVRPSRVAEHGSSEGRRGR